MPPRYDLRQPPPPRHNQRDSHVFKMVFLFSTRRAFRHSDCYTNHPPAHALGGKLRFCTS